MAIQQIRIPGVGEYNIEEWLHWPEFTTVEGAAGANVNLRGFSYVVGQNVPQAGTISTGARQSTDSDTNRTTRNRMNHDEAFICYSMTYEHFALEGTTHSDSVFTAPPLDNAATAPILSGTSLRLMQRDLLLELFVGAGISKPMAQAPLAYYGQGIGAVAFSAGDALGIANGAATALNLNYGTAGYVSPANQRRWALPVYIDSDRTMYVRLTSPAGPLLVDQDWRLRIYLDGLKRRAVA
jgi:hypothetical protein